MQDKIILKKAIEKAIKNGYASGIRDDYMFKKDKAITQLILDTLTKYSIIFSHNFAKAFFDENYYVEYIDDEGRWSDSNLLNWQYHLQQMVLEENPIKYLEHFL